MAEGEDQVYGDGDGGGGGGGGGGDDGGDDRLSRLEKRLSTVSTAITGLARSQETRDLRGRIAQRRTQLENARKQSEHGVKLAERFLAEAHDDGDGAQVARAQRELTEAVTRRERAISALDDHNKALKELESRSNQPAAAPAENTDRLDAWKARNAAWYGVDVTMTKAAKDIDRGIREAGVIPVGSNQYFEAIDRKMARQFPDKLRQGPDTAGGGRSHSGGSVSAGRIPKDSIEAWRRMGLDVSDDKLLERMVKHRQTAVDKGILGERPVLGPVVTR